MCESAITKGTDTISVKVEFLYHLLHERTTLLKKVEVISLFFEQFKEKIYQ